MKLIIRMLAFGFLLAFLAQTVSAKSDPEFVAGNPECSDLGFEEIVKIDPPRTGTFGPIILFVHEDNTLDWKLDWRSNETVTAMIVKGGPGANVYTSQNEGLHAPTNPNNGRFYGLSHITFCQGEEPPATPTPTSPTQPSPTNTPETPDSPISMPETPKIPNEMPPGIKLPQTGRTLE